MKKTQKSQKTTSYNAHTATKMVWVMVLVGFISLFLVGTVSAGSWITEFDNVKNYDEETKTVDIRNSVLGIPFLQLGKIAEIRLDTPEVVYVIRGEDRKVAEFTITNYDDYSNVFKAMEFYDLKRENKEINREFTYKYKNSIGFKEINDYGNSCSETKSLNGTIIRECENVLIGTHQEEVFEWETLDTSKPLPEGEITIGIFTDVLPNENVEWIPTFFGVKIKEWAVWTESLNIDLETAYHFEEQDTTGTGTIIDELGTNNGTNAGADNTTGAIGYGYDFVRANNDYIDGGFVPATGSANRTVCALINPDVNNVIQNIIAYGTDLTNQKYNFLIQSTGVLQIALKTTLFTSSLKPTVGSWNLLCLTLNGTTIADHWVWIGYSNGTLVSQKATGVATVNTGSDTNVWLGASEINANQELDGQGDNFMFWDRGLSGAEIEQIHNEGNFLDFGLVVLLNITLISPDDTSNFTASNVTFNVTVTDNVEVSEVKLFIDGAVNDTNTSKVNGTYIYNLDFVNGDHNWSIGATDNEDNKVNSSVRTFSIDTVAPIITNQNITEADENGIISIHVINTNLTFTWNVTDVHLDTCTFNHDGNVTVTCSANTTSFNITDFSNKNLTFFANDTSGKETNVSVSWDYNVSQFVSTFSATTFETKTETFAANITLGADLNGTTISNVRLFHNGSENTGGTVTNTAGQNYNLSHSIDISVIGTGVSNWFFSFDADSVNVNTTTETQTVTEVLFQLCNATHSTQFINFTFRNETTNEEVVPASISSTWVFYLGQGLINKTLTFSNTTENLNYSFCCSAVNDVLTTTSSIAYTNSISQQRIFEPTLLTLTNVTDTRTLYLLPTFKGLFSQFRTEDTLGNSIVGAIGVITRILNGVLIGITSDTTDGSGLVLFFLDPDITYTATFSAVGFDDNTFTFVPTTDLRTVVMGGEVVAVEGSEISLGMSYNITPTNTTLNNGTDVLFQFNVTSTETITFMGFDISNGTAVLLSRSQASNGSLSGTLNTGNHSRLTGVYTISTTNETITISRIWKVDQSFIGDYSIFRQFNLYMDYGFEDFGRLLIVILVLAGAMILMSKEIGIDEEVKMAVGILIVWAFSIVGWLDTGIVIETASSGINSLTQFSNQYGIAMVSTIAAAYFILRRVFRQI